MCLECGNDCAGGHTWILAGVNLGDKICQQSFRCFDIHFLEASWSKDYERHGHHSVCSAALVINYEFDIRILDLDCAEAWSIRLAWLLSKLFKMMRGCDRLVLQGLGSKASKRPVISLCCGSGFHLWWYFSATLPES